VSVKLPFDAHQDKSRPRGNTTIKYHGGPVLLNTVPVFVIYYGDVPSGTQDIINAFFSDLSPSGQYDVNQTYYNAQMLHISGALSFVPAADAYHDNYSQGVGSTLGSSSIPKIIKAAIDSHGLPADPTGVYFVITAPDQKVSGFCTSFCAYHTHTTINNTDIKYALVPDPGQACTGCDGNVAVYGEDTTPNGDRGADEVTDSAFHELSETVSDPDLNAWYTSNGSENGDLCNYNYGATYKAKNGSTANARLGKNDYLIQTIWENTGAGFCANVYP
jgi:phosphate-induced protein 1